jgi:ribulose-phosphate 3-epimerase
MKEINRHIVPAILTENPVILEAMLRRAEEFADWVQIDIMDGVFVPSRSITSNDIFDIKPKMAWEAHLMVQEPVKYLKGFHLAGARRIVVHYEAVKDCVIEDHINSMGMEAGLAINPETPLEVLSPQVIRRLDSVLFMAVHPGFYGAKFIPEVLDKISSFRAIYPDVNIAIDGGVKANNVALVAASGVNEICVGSAVFAQADPAASFNELTNLAKTGWLNSR